MTDLSSDNARNPNPFLRFLHGLWRGADGLRKVLHLIVLLAMFSIIVVAVNKAAPIMPTDAALELRPSGVLVEQFEGDPFDRAKLKLFGGTPESQTVVQDLVDALRFASTDKRIKLVHLELSNLAGGGLSKLQRIAHAMQEVRDAGKPIIASADFMSQGGYFLAAHADKVYLHPSGMIQLQGYGSFRTYYKDAIDKLRIDWNVFRVGSHKTFVEPYTRMDMSSEAREDLSRLTDQLWTMYKSDVTTARGLDEGAVDDFVESLVDNIAAAGGGFAEAALAHRLVDGLMTRNEISDLLVAKVGADKEAPDGHVAAAMYDYIAQMRLLQGTGLQAENVAVIVASGEITFGSPPPGMTGADSTSKLLKKALDDDSVAAVVFRVDSPGGSVFASDVIGNEIARLQEAGKPVVASMGSTAASGGYWISAGADEIFASPATVTGSIGIFGMFQTFQRSMEALGINVDGIGSTTWAGEFRPDRAMSEHAKALFQSIIEDGYDDFITRVATYRGMEKSAVDAIGQGRVWTGQDAMDNGLVDELGDLEDAIAAAARLAGLDEGEYGVRHIGQELTPTEQLLIDIFGAASTMGVDLHAFAPRSSRLQAIAGKLESLIEPLLRFDDPQGVYAHCLCQID
ncbi:MAG TPA: signal peptide peptidase SppA [Woeseiaceae bacterium]|nr:signal peptide peptidase SppA [Woeseiaceae bacterium]